MEGIEAAQTIFVPDAVEDVIHQYQNTVYRIALAHCRNTSDAEDVTQEVFLRYLKKTPAFTGEGHLKAWLIRVTINVSKSLLSSAWREKTVPLDEHSAISTDDPVSIDTYHAVMSLPEKYRTVVILYYDK